MHARRGSLPTHKNAGRVTTLIVGAFAFSFSTLASAQGICQLDQIVPVVPTNPVEFGYSVDIDGDWAIIGSPGESNSRGSVYFYQRSGDTWTQVHRFQFSDIQPSLTSPQISLTNNTEFGYAVAIDRNRAVVGAPGARRTEGTTSGGAGVVGAAIFFTLSSGMWSYEDHVSPTSVNQRFGSSVDIIQITGGNDKAVVGAPEFDSAKGSVGVYHRISNQWVHQNWLDNLLPSGQETIGGDRFGFSVAIERYGSTSTDYVAVGSPYRDIISAGEGSAGRLSIFLNDGSGWEYDRSFSSQNPMSTAHYGASVAFYIQADNRLGVVVGAPEHAGGGHVEPRQGTSGNPTGFGTAFSPMTAPGTVAFGTSLSVTDGYNLVIGDPGGGAYHYDQSASGLPFTNRKLLEGDDTVSGDSFGQSVGITDDGATVIVGAPDNPTAGSVYVFDIGTDTDSDGVGDDCDNCPNDSNPNQNDSDSDGIGNACDDCPNDADNDADGDGVCGDVDICEGSDDALVGTACDGSDVDTCATGVYVCPNDVLTCTDDAATDDADGDGICDSMNSCPNDPDDDIDGDGVCGDVDNCPYDDNPLQEDMDGDGFGDICDACPTSMSTTDSDSDGIIDECDNCPSVHNPSQADWDGDGYGDLCDNCRKYCSIDQTDSDDNGIGDVCERNIGDELNPPDCSGFYDTTDLAESGGDTCSGGDLYGYACTVDGDCTGGGACDPAEPNYFYYGNVYASDDGRFFAGEPGAVEIQYRDDSGDPLGRAVEFHVREEAATPPMGTPYEIEAVDYFLDYPTATATVPSAFNRRIKYNTTVQEDPNDCLFPQLQIDSMGIVSTPCSLDKLFDGYVVIQYTDGPPPTSPLVGLEVLHMRNFGQAVTSDVPIGRVISHPAGADCHARLLVNSISGQDVAWQHTPDTIVSGAGGLDIYPIRVNQATAQNLQIAWYKATPFVDCATATGWPTSVTRHTTNWPADPQTHIVDAGTVAPGSIIDLSAYCSPELMGNSVGSINAEGNFQSSATGYSVLKLGSGPDAPNCEDTVDFEVVYSYDHENAAVELSDTTVDVGTLIMDYRHDPRAPRAHGYLHAGTNYNEAVFLDSGQVIPVNDSSVFGLDEMWWFEEGRYAPGVYWPYLARSYGTQWPTSTDEIVIASRLGAGAYPDETTTTIYQAGHVDDVNETTGVVTPGATIGWNPNDEHAQLANDGADIRVYAVRDDNPWNLASPLNDDPYVLVQYEDQTEDTIGINFDGSPDTIKVPYDSALNPASFTVEGWVRIDGLDPGSGDFRAVMVHSAGSVRKGFFINTTEDGRWRFRVGMGSGASDFATIEDTFVASVDQWTHLAGTYDATTQTMAFYIDGELVGTYVLPMPHVSNQNDDFHLGRHNSSATQYLNGSLDEVRLWDRALTASEINTMRFTSPPSNTPNLVAYWPLDEFEDLGVQSDGADDVRDVGPNGFHGDAIGGPVIDSEGYPNPLAGTDIWRMGVHKVVGEGGVPQPNPDCPDAAIDFDYSSYLTETGDTICVEAGQPVIPLFPVNWILLGGTAIESGPGDDACFENITIAGDAVWRDRKGTLWAVEETGDGYDQEAGTSGGVALGAESSAAIDLYEKWVPIPYAGGGDDGSGGCSPWRDFGSDNPTDITYRPQWPVEPTRALNVGELVNMEDFCGPLTTLHDSVGIKIIDPTHEVSEPLAMLPGEVNLANLPPHIIAGEIGGGGAMLEDRIRHQSGTLYWIGVMSERDRDFLKNLDDDSDPGPDDCTSDYCTAIDALYTASREQLSTPLTAPDRKFVSLADANVVPGHVTLAAQNVVGVGSSCVDGDPVQVEVWSVDCPPVTGEITPIQPTCPFSEKLILQHTIDGGGNPENLSYQWQVCDRIDCTDLEWVNAPLPSSFSDGRGLREILIAGASPFTLSDSYWRVRYRGFEGCPCAEGVDCNEDSSGSFLGWPYVADGTQDTMISDWSSPQLAEGWIKRLVRGLTPFDQRIENFHTTAVATYVNMIQQAGIRFENPVALNCNSAVINGLGLIEAYETAQRRAEDFSIDIGLDLEGANQAIMLVAGKIADLYTLLANEAYGDSVDPTIGLFEGAPTPGPTYTPSGVFCFQGIAQTPDLLGEELGLLRGISSSVTPTVEDGRIVATRYNRLPWNFTSTDGQVAYANNYQVTSLTDLPACGDTGEPPCNGARDLYPQGHGDAWGHYLTAMRKYYDLLKHPVFTWVIGTEEVLVDGDPIEVGFEHERRFAKVAAAKARAGVDIVNLTFRQKYTADPSQQNGYPDEVMICDIDSAVPGLTCTSDAQCGGGTCIPRAWGVIEWGRRAGQGTYYDWLTANALLDDIDDDPTHPADTLRKVDRETVGELKEIADAFTQIQSTIQNADDGLNPLGLASNVLPFGLTGISETSTHFDQMYDQSLVSLENAHTAFEYANDVSRRLRADEGGVEDFQNLVVEREFDFNNRLVEIFGAPYAEDVGKGLTYSDDECLGGQCPDIFHFDYIDDVAGLLGTDVSDAQTTTITAEFTQYLPNSISGATGAVTRTVSFNVSTESLGLQKPAGWLARPEPGEIQVARSEALQARADFLQGVARYEGLLDRIEAQADLLEQLYDLRKDVLNVLKCGLDASLGDCEPGADDTSTVTLNRRIINNRRSALHLRKIAEEGRAFTEAMAESLPESTIAGTSVGGDMTSAARGAFFFADIAQFVFDIAANEEEIAELRATLDLAEGDAQGEIAIVGWQGNEQIATQVARLRQLLTEEAPLRIELAGLEERLDQARGRYRAAVGKGLRLLQERTHFRQQTANHVSEYRYRDLAYRIFRNEALQKFRAQFDLAARYVFMTAKVYDYETNLLGTDASGGQQFLTDIVKERIIGRVDAGVPAIGNGLADMMAQLRANFDSLTGIGGGLQYQDISTRVFSLRKSFFGLPLTSQYDDEWQAALNDAVVLDLSSLPEYRQLAVQLGPISLTCGSGFSNENMALALRFNTSIRAGENFFGLPLQGGEQIFNPTYSAIKFRTVGVRFVDYPTGGGKFVLTDNPPVYLLPIGNDVMRVPLNCSSTDFQPTRQWSLLDQTLPVPFPISEVDLSGDDWQPWDDLTGGPSSLVARRRYLAFDARDESVPITTDLSTNLLGRSVWNSQWLLIIPGISLDGCPDEGLDIFINGTDGSGPLTGVKDIKLVINAYGFGGCTAGVTAGDDGDGSPEKQEERPRSDADSVAVKSE